MQIRPDCRQVEYHVDAHFGQVRAWSDAGEYQQLRGPEGARGEHHLTRTFDSDVVGVGSGDVLHAGTAAAAVPDTQQGHQSLGRHRQVRPPVPDRREVGVGGALPSSVEDVGVRQGKPSGEHTSRGTAAHHDVVELVDPGRGPRTSRHDMRLHSEIGDQRNAKSEGVPWQLNEIRIRLFGGVLLDGRVTDGGAPHDPCGGDRCPPSAAGAPPVSRRHGARLPHCPAMLATSRASRRTPLPPCPVACDRGTRAAADSRRPPVSARRRPRNSVCRA